MARTKTSGPRSNNRRTQPASKVARKEALPTGPRSTPLPPQLLEAIRHGSLDLLRSAIEEVCKFVPEARDFLLLEEHLLAPVAELKTKEVPVDCNDPPNKKRKLDVEIVEISDG
ncbi:hypothetical protein BDZ45DRAFT_811532 [Acephala macrosclerotiorum]|nr:hypothetical protein BDZ45DRAFT_811532 [Acephala macrosclerotiorum]